MSGIYHVSVRRIADRKPLRAAAYSHVGLAVDGVDQDQIVLASAFTEAGFTVADLMAYIDGIHALATDPSSVGAETLRMFEDRGGVDSEGNRTDLFMLSLGGKDGSHDWLACAEAAYAVWPRLLDTLAAEVGGHVFDADGEMRPIEAGHEIVTPKLLRLKSGWDLDAEGNQIWLPIEEAWRRFVAHTEERGRDGGEERFDAKTMRKMRRHMKSYYGGFPTTKAKREHDEQKSKRKVGVSA
jgi:hypothetical protein